ncbi:putative sugar O-methyltransferase [Methylobacillus arboreus]|uniref:putative sugar O-methyltransferase n=1 Tax=Methylobacillus arboreus TaxID=755170 RepID=UPI001E3B5638|nr:putative sugar O-methyltransferase [Methylobacillus arboreus]MCB5189977.1 putative sugar O-methyltransferase [Methylobacillus arboreus]
MNKYPELTLAIEDMKSQDSVYQPSAFWREASNQIVQEVCEAGIENFRSLPKPLGFFVPTYGSPANSFSVEQISRITDWFSENYPDSTKLILALDQFLNGYSAALSDYRVLLAADDAHKLPYLHTFSESKVGNPVEHWEFDGKKYSRSALNYILGLALLKRHLVDVPKTVLEIGGGFGTLGEVLTYSGIQGIRYIDIDIPPTSYIAQYYLAEVLGKKNVATYAQLKAEQTIEIDALPTASVLASWQIEKLQGKVDLFVNFISFQEMEPEIVSNYLQQVVRLQTTWILLRNMREGKQVRKKPDDIGVDIPIKSEDYLSMLPGYELVERNVFPYGYRTVDGYHSELLLLRRIV